MFPCLIGDESGAGGLLAGADRQSLAGWREDGEGPVRRRFRVGGSGLRGGDDWKTKRPGCQPFHKPNQNHHPNDPYFL